DRPGLADVLASGRAAILPVGPGVTTSLLTIGFFAPITNQSGTLLGGFLFESDVAPDSAFNDEISSLRRGETGEFSFIDGAGVVVASSNPERLGRPLSGTPLTLEPGFHRISGRVETIADVPSAGWRVDFRQAESEFEGGLSGRLRIVLLLV